MAVRDLNLSQGKRWSDYMRVDRIYIIFIMHSLLMRSAETINCSEPTTQALYSALQESVFGKTDIRPVIYPTTPVNITINLYVYGILGVDEKGQVLDMFIWVDMSWNIDGLSWDIEECGTRRISVLRTSLWMPDVVINEFMDENKVPPTYYVYVFNTGKVIDSKPFHVISSCNLDIYTFPFDIQNCTYTFNSYLHTVSDVQLFFLANGKDVFEDSLKTIGTNGEWELIDITTYKPKREYMDYEPYDQLIYYIVLKRKAALYVVNLILPSCFLVALDVFSFLLPVKHVDRSTFKMTLILGYTVFLLLMNSLLPSTGNNIPLINVFFSLSLAMMVGSLLETIFITNISLSSNHYPRLPKFARVLFLHYIATLVFLKKTTATEVSNPKSSSSSKITSSETLQEEKMTEFSPDLQEKMLQEPVFQELRNISKDLQTIRQRMDEELTVDQHTQEWIHLGLVIDRALFCLYVVFICVSFVTILVMWVSWYSQRSRT